MTLYKYHGAGNDFLIGDNRDGAIVLDTAKIQLLCDRHLGFGSDGLMLLENSDTIYLFVLVYTFRRSEQHYKLPMRNRQDHRYYNKTLTIIGNKD